MQKQVVALGFFDGVHRGHGGLLSAVRQLADQLHVPAAAMTFDTHPMTLLTGQPTPLLNTREDRALLMERLYGIEKIITLHFDRETMALPWEEFAETYLLERFRACALVCGHDFRFGCRGEGTAEKLAAWCEARGLPCRIIPKVEIDGQTVSSTLIRQMVREGDLEAANRFYGHAHLLTGVVEHGQHLGRTIGIPTVNLAIPEGLVVPAYGVYAAHLTVDGHTYRAVTNIGCHPTVGACIAPKAESWLPGFSGNLYGKTVELELFSRLREERRFPSLEDMAAEIRRNAEQMQTYFDDHVL